MVHRASFLSELSKPIPRECMHVDKKLVNVDNAEDGGINLHFQDCSIEHAHALIGADGINGYVRQYILGAAHLATEPVFAGWWDCRNLVPCEKAKTALGEEYFHETRQCACVGNGGFIMHDILDDGKTVQCVGCLMVDEGWRSKEWKKELDRK